MSGGMPELGSKISLISKADIRYEGRLYTVDPQECTIALSSVRSFGTEDRETQYQIAPQGQIYDYILFRGSDIKDIRVINNSLPHPNDPAIMQVQLPNGQHLMPHFSMPNMTAAQAPVMGTVSAYGGTFGTMGGLGGITSTAATGPVASLAPGAPAPYMLGNQQSTQQQQPKGVQSQSQQHSKQSSELKSHHDILIKSPQVQQEQLQSQQQQQQQPKQLQNEPILHSGMAMKPNPLQQQVTTTRPPSAMNSSLFNSTVGSNALAGNNLSSSSLLTTVDCMSGLRGGGGVIVGGITTNTVVNNATKNQNIAHIGIGIGGNSTAMPIDANCGSRMIGVGMGELNLNAAGTTTTKKLGLLKDKDQDILAGASRSTTPISLISRKSPSTADVGANHQQQQNHQSQHANQQQQHLNQNNVGHGGQLRDGGVQKRQNHQQQSHQPQQRGNVNQRNKNDYYHQQSQQQHHQQQHNINNTNNNNRRDRRDNTGRTDYINHANANIGANINGIRSYNNRRGNTLTNNRSRWNDGYSWASKSTFKQTLLPRNNKNQIKFEQDFDFEQANNKFEELRSQLSKLKVGDEPKSSEQINGETDKKDDSGNETGAGEHEPEEDEITVGYDKTKSFFDNISCEAAQDRSKNKGHDWRQERKLNSETFGVSSTRRGGYRGHGNYYNNRNMGGYNVGAYNRGYRGGNSYRTRINNRNNLTHNRDTNAMGRNSTDTYSTNTTTTTATTNNVNALKNQTQQPQAQNQDGGNEVNVNGIAPSTSKSVAAAGLPENATQSPLMTTVNAGQ